MPINQYMCHTFWILLQYVSKDTRHVNLEEDVILGVALNDLIEETYMLLK